MTKFEKFKLEYFANVKNIDDHVKKIDETLNLEQ